MAAIMTSPFLSLLNTNYIPSDTEIPVLKALVQEEHDLVDQLDEEIEIAEKALSVLKERRGVRMIYVRDHRALLEPIKRVPTDILRAIFLVCLSNAEPGYFMDERSNMTKNHPSVILSHVCRSWRQLSLDTPRLWATINVYPPIFHNQQMSSYQPYHTFHGTESWERGILKLTAILKIWLARSSSCPLSVSFSGSWATLVAVESYEVMYKHFENLLDVLCAVSVRWEDINFKISISSPESPLLRLLLLEPDQIPLLRRIKLAISYPSYSTQIREKCTHKLDERIGLLKSRSLRSLGISLLWEPLSKLPVNWSNMTHIYLGGYASDSPSPVPIPISAPHFGAEQALELFKGCPRLIHCDLKLNDTLPQMKDEFHIIGPITLLFLQTMILDFSFLTPRFSSSLILPSLRTLLLQNPFGQWERAIVSNGVLSCIQCFGKQVKTLEINYTTLTPSDFASCLKLIPNVVQLRLNNRGACYYNTDTFLGPLTLFASDILDKFTPKPDDPGPTCYLPKLETFTCALTEESEFTEIDLVEFAMARRQPQLHPADDLTGGIARLRNLKVNFVQEKTIDVEEELRKRGVDMEDFYVEISHPYIYPLDEYRLSYEQPYHHRFDGQSI